MNVCCKSEIAVSAVEIFHADTVALIDAQIPDPGTLQNGIHPGIRSHLISDSEQGLDSLLAYLKAYPGLKVLHLIAHGGPGYLQLGGERIDAAALSTRRHEIALAAENLPAHAQVLIYGCDVAVGDEGAAFVQLLAQLLGASVAASTSPVGAADKGGDWHLDHATGPISATPAFSAETTMAWQGLLQDKAYDEDQVNSYIAGDQHSPAIAVLADGSYVTTWVSTGQDSGATLGVYAQRFSASGIPIGSEFRVNTTEAGNQSEPRTAALSDGGFVVVWTDSAADGSSNGVYAQRYDASGVPQGGESLVNTTTAGSQSDPSVSAYDGGYVVSLPRMAASPAVVASTCCSSASITLVSRRVVRRWSTRWPTARRSPAPRASPTSMRAPMAVMSWFGPIPMRSTAVVMGSMSSATTTPARPLAAQYRSTRLPAEISTSPRSRN